MKENKFEKLKNNAKIKMLLWVLGLILYAVLAVLPGVCFLFWPFWLCVAIITVFLLLFPLVLCFGRKQKRNAVCYFALPAAIYVAVYIYLKTRAWYENIGISVASSIAKSNMFGLLNNSGYATLPKLIFVGISGVILTCLYPFCFTQKLRWRWFFGALGIFLIASVFVFWNYIELYLKS